MSGRSNCRGGYATRRIHIGQLAAPVREKLEAIIDSVRISDPGAQGLSTWTALDSRLEGVTNEVRSARSTDDLQDVGRRCREVLIDAS
jgi:hypothetical protein